MAAKSKVDKKKAIQLKMEKNLSYGQIAAIQGVSRQAIHQQIQKFIPDTQIITAFKNNRADILAHAQLKAIESYLSLDIEQHKSLVERRGLVDFGILFDKERLELGKSTSIISSMTDDQLDARLRALVAREQAVDAVTVSESRPIMELHNKDLGGDI